MRALRLVVCLSLAAFVAGCAAPREAAGPPPLPATNYFEVSTPVGAFVVELSDETPLHRDNFKRLAVDGFYDGTTFHRVIRGFMVQGGDPNSRDEIPSNDGLGGPGYTLPAEIVPGLGHTAGAVAAAREGDAQNPERRSSGSQFYVVTGRASHLDGAYTVFGRVVEGLDVLAALEQAPTLRAQSRFAPPPVRDRPLEPIPMRVRPLPDHEAPPGSGGR